jgi:hypothetical protein
LTPIEGEGTHGNAVSDAEHLVEFDIVRGDPTAPRKAGEGSKEVRGQKSDTKRIIRKAEPRGVKKTTDYR